MVLCACNFSPQGLRQEDGEFRDSLSYKETLSRLKITTTITTTTTTKKPSVLAHTSIPSIKKSDIHEFQLARTP